MNERKRSKRSCESVCVTREWATPSDALVTQSYSMDTSDQKYSNTTIYVLYMIFAFKRTRDIIYVNIVVAKLMTRGNV